MTWCCRCDNITISPALLGELEASKEPLPRKLWPTMGGCDEPQLDMHESNKSLFDKMHGEDQMAVDKLKEGIDGLWHPCLCVACYVVSCIVVVHVGALNSQFPLNIAIAVYSCAVALMTSCRCVHLWQCQSCAQNGLLTVYKCPIHPAGMWIGIVWLWLGIGCII